MAKRAPTRAPAKPRRRRRPATRRPASREHPRSAAHAGREFQKLVTIMQQLRSPGGCPWDRKQTLATLRPFVLEETYEVLEAIESGMPAQLCEELGDFLFEAVFLAQISEEQDDFSIADA